MNRFNTIVPVLAASAAYNFARLPARQAWTMAFLEGLVIIILCWVAIRKTDRDQYRVAIAIKVSGIVVGLIVGGTFHLWNPWS